MSVESIETPEEKMTRWLVVVAGFLSMTVAAGVGWFVFPVFLPVWSEEFGWSMRDIGLAVTVWGIVGAVFSPVCGWLIDRHGARVVMAAGTVGQFFSILLLSRIEALWHFYAVMAVFAIANVASAQIPVQTVISQWFDRSRGKAMGFALLGIGVGGFIFPNLAGLLLDVTGWRGAYVIFAFAELAVLVPVVLWVRKGPAGAAVEEAGDAGAADTPDLTASESIRTRSFWTVGLGDAITGLVFAVITVHMVAFSIHAGLDDKTATFGFSIFVAVQALGILAFGAIADAAPIRPTMVICYALPALAVAMLFKLEAAFVLFAFALLAGFCAGGRTALYPLALGQCFGVAHLGTILGWLNVPFLIGNAIGPPLAGQVFDSRGSYGLVFLGCIVLAAASAVLISLLRDERPRFRRTRLNRNGEV